MKKLIVVIAILLMATDLYAENSCELAWHDCVYRTIKSYRPGGRIEPDALKPVLKQIDVVEDAMHASIMLWKAGERDYLELAWWRQENRGIRAGILALFFTQGKETVSNFPSFDYYLSRFSKSEQKYREEELQFVLQNRSRLKELFMRCDL